MRVCAAGDDRERDANPVDQQASFAPVFFPDPWGWDPRIRLQDEERTPPAATSESANVLHWRCQTRAVDVLRTGCQWKARWRKRFGAAAWACGRHQACEDKRDSLTAVEEESMAQPSPKTHPRQSMT